MKILSSSFKVTVFYLLITGTAHAAPAPPASVCQDALSITKTMDMDFGSYIGGTTGTIDMPATGGAMTYSGIIPVGAGAGVAATFELVTTNKDCKRGDLTLPSSITIYNGGAPITITNLVIDPRQTTFRVRTTPYVLTIGGTLQADAGDASGTYVGPFDIFFTYP